MLCLERLLLTLRLFSSSPRDYLSGLPLEVFVLSGRCRLPLTAMIPRVLTASSTPRWPITAGLPVSMPWGAAVRPLIRLPTARVRSLTETSAVSEGHRMAIMMALRSAIPGRLSGASLLGSRRE
jgi:hypothetical protein